MKAGYVLTPEAEQDLEDVFFFVRDRFGLPVAERVWTAYLEAFERIATFPESGAVRPELWPPPFRFVTVGPGLIAYRSDSRPVQIVRLARAARDGRA